MLMRFARRIARFPYSRADFDQHSQAFIESNKTAPDLEKLLDQLQRTPTRNGHNALEGLYKELGHCGQDIASERTRMAQRIACIELAISSGIHHMILATAQKQKTFCWSHLARNNQRLVFLANLDPEERSQSVHLLYVYQLFISAWLSDLYGDLFSQDDDGKLFDTWLNAMKECYREYFTFDMNWLDLIATQSAAGHQAIADQLAAIKDDEINPQLLIADRHFLNAQNAAKLGRFDTAELSKGLDSLSRLKRDLKERHGGLAEKVVALLET
jgi:hypothetical protein